MKTERESILALVEKKMCEAQAHFDRVGGFVEPIPTLRELKKSIECGEHLKLFPVEVKSDAVK